MSVKKYTYEQAKEDFEKRGYILLTPKEEYKNSTQKLDYICPVHGKQQISYYHLREGKGCMLCGRERTRQASLKPDFYYQEIAEQKGFEFVGVEVKNGVKYVKVICPHHRDKGIQYVQTQNLLRNNGCKYCAHNVQKTHEEFVQDIKGLFGESITIVSKYNCQNQGKIKCRCNIHNIEYETLIVNLLKGYSGCPECSRTKSNGERQIGRILKSWNVAYEEQKTFQNCKDIKCLPFDFYLSQCNVLIEYDGEHHYRPVNFNNCNNGIDIYLSTKKHDKMKDEFCIQNHIPLIRIPYTQINNLESYLFDQLVKYNVIQETSVH